MKTKKLISMLLALMMLAACFVGCANTGDGDSTTKTPATGSSNKGDTVLAKDVHDVPEMNYDDELILIYSRGHEWFDDDVCVEADMGDKITKAVWQRQANVENHLGVQLKNTVTYDASGWGNIGDDVQSMRDAGRNDYSIVVDALYHSGTNACNNLYLNLSGLQYLNLEKDYWSQLINASSSYKGKQFFVTGSISLSTYRLVYTTFINETMFKNKGYDDPYAWVDSGEWTISKMYTLAEEFYDDSTGTVAGEKDDGDTYGVLLSRMTGLDPFVASCEIKLLDKTADDTYKFVFDTKKAAQVTEAVGNLYWVCEGSNPYEHMSTDTEFDAMAEKFGQGTAAMAVLRLIEAEKSYVAGVTFGLGVLPVPKYEEGAGTYYGCVHDTASAFAIPNLEGKTDAEMQMLGAVLEVMASEGANTVVPEYYEVTLKERTIAQTKPMEMVDRIVLNLTYDAAVYYPTQLGQTEDSGYNAPHQFLRDLVGRASSRYKSAQRRLGILYNNTSGYIDDLNEALDNIDGNLA